MLLGKVVLYKRKTNILLTRNYLCILIICDCHKRCTLRL